MALKNLLGKKWRRHDPADSVPLAIPIGFERPPSLAEQVARLVRDQHVQMALHARGQETFEEANDFDIGDDFDPHSPYEEEFDGQFAEELALEKERTRRSAEAAEASKKPRRRFQEEAPVSDKDVKKTAVARPNGASAVRDEGSAD